MSEPGWMEERRVRHYEPPTKFDPRDEVPTVDLLAHAIADILLERLAQHEEEIVTRMMEKLWDEPFPDREQE